MTAIYLLAWLALGASALAATLADHYLTRTRASVWDTDDGRAGRHRAR